MGPDPSFPQFRSQDRREQRRQLHDAILLQGSSGSASASCADWSSGEILGTLIECNGLVTTAGRQIKLVLIGSTVARKLGLSARAERPCLVGGMLTVVSDGVDPDALELAFGIPGRSGLH